MELPDLGTNVTFAPEKLFESLPLFSVLGKDLCNSGAMWSLIV